MLYLLVNSTGKRSSEEKVPKNSLFTHHQRAVRAITWSWIRDSLAYGTSRFPQLTLSHHCCLYYYFYLSILPVIKKADIKISLFTLLQRAAVLGYLRVECETLELLSLQDSRRHLFRITIIDLILPISLSGSEVISDKSNWINHPLRAVLDY